MKLLIPLLVLCAAFFVASDAAPILPSGFKLEAASAEDQQLDEWANTFLSRVFTPAAARDGTAAARDGTKTLFGALPTKSTDNGETYVQSDSDKKLLQTILKEIRKFFSSSNTDPDDERSQSFFDGMDSILSIIEKRLDEGPAAVSDKEIMRTMFDAMNNYILSAAGRNTDPNDEITHTLVNVYKTFFSLIRNELNGGVIQSNDSEMKQAFMNFLGEIQSDSGDNEIMHTAINIMKTIYSAIGRSIDPRDEWRKTVVNAIGEWLSFMSKSISNELQLTDKELLNEYVSHFSNIISAMVKRNENGKIQYPDHVGGAKTQQWGSILGSLATSVLNEYLDG
jgi:hypothetical protein